MNNERTKISTTNDSVELFKSKNIEQIAMEVDSSSQGMQKILKLLTKLYENPLEASIRETVSNAMDATIEAGTGGFVSITTPNPMKQFIVIEDSGVGMSYDDMVNVISKYGASTKAESLNQTGAYGLGLKAPLSYTDEFTIASAKNGKLTTVAVRHKSEGFFIEIMGEQPSDRQGTTITIPIESRDVSRAKQIAMRYLSEPSPVVVKVNGLTVEKNNNRILMPNQLTLLVDSNNVAHKATYHMEKNTEYDSRYGDPSVQELLVGIASCSNEQWEAINKLLMADFDNNGEDLTKYYPAINYVISGWRYREPSAAKRENERRSYRRNNPFMNLLIELPAGILNFDSSRDAITNDTRALAVEKAIVNQVYSNDFKHIILQRVIDGIDTEFKGQIFAVLYALEEQSRNGEINIVHDRSLIKEHNDIFITPEIEERLQLLSGTSFSPTVGLVWNKSHTVLPQISEINEGFINTQVLTRLSIPGQVRIDTYQFSRAGLMASIRLENQAVKFNISTFTEALKRVIDEPVINTGEIYKLFVLAQMPNNRQKTVIVTDVNEENLRRTVGARNRAIEGVLQEFRTTDTATSHDNNVMVLFTAGTKAEFEAYHKAFPTEKLKIYGAQEFADLANSMSVRIATSNIDNERELRVAAQNTLSHIIDGKVQKEVRVESRDKTIPIVVVEHSYHEADEMLANTLTRMGIEHEEYYILVLTHSRLERMLARTWNAMISFADVVLINKKGSLSRASKLATISEFIKENDMDSFYANVKLTDDEIALNSIAVYLAERYQISVDYNLMRDVRFINELMTIKYGRDLELLKYVFSGASEKSVEISSVASLSRLGYDIVAEPLSEPLREFLDVLISLSTSRGVVQLNVSRHYRKEGYAEAVEDPLLTLLFDVIYNKMLKLSDI